jgi:hypothetical protein
MVDSPYWISDYQILIRLHKIFLPHVEWSGCNNELYILSSDLKEEVSKIYPNMNDRQVSQSILSLSDEEIKEYLEERST